MYGYVRPHKGELKVREYEQYRAMYCGMCRVLEQHCGFGARMLLSYDMCFLAMVFSGAMGCPVSVCSRRCPVSFWRRSPCAASNAAMELAADCTVILAYAKACDGVRDEKGVKKLAYRFSRVLLRRKYRKSAGRLPAFAAGCRENLAGLAQHERERTQSLDIPASCFADMLAALSEYMPEGQRRQARQLFYHIGRWVYLADAWDDVEADMASGNYNCIVQRFELHSPEERERAAGELEQTLAHSAQAAAAAAELMELDTWAPIVRNVLYLGLPSIACAIRQGQTKQRSSKHGSL